MALTLWEQLGDRTPQHHQRSVELFYQLHNLVPTSSICEDVISQQLTNKDKVSLQLQCTQQERGGIFFTFIQLSFKESLFQMSGGC